MESEGEAERQGVTEVALTEQQVERILAGEEITKDGVTFGVGNALLDVGGTKEKSWQDLLSGRQSYLRWISSNPEVKVVLADEDETPTDEMTMENPKIDTSLSTVDVTDQDHVTMEVTMDISDCSETEKEITNALARQFEESFEELVTKSRDYGYSYAISGRKLAESNGTPFDNPIRSIVYSLLTRKGDKDERLIENVYGDGSQEVSDPPAITAQEAGNYYQLIALVLDNPELINEVADQTDDTVF